MGLATGVVGKGVVDAERRGHETDGEPRRRVGFLLHDPEPLLQEVFDVAFYNAQLKKWRIQRKLRCSTRRAGSPTHQTIHVLQTLEVTAG
ncbi:hypothetical protein GCM10027597_62820 [Saccharopolyspora tripterygii]